jgi:hypothetical protein
MNFLGIDPGKSGGLAILDYEGRVIELTRMPKVRGEDEIDEVGVWQWISRHLTAPVKCVVWIEKVSGYIGNAHTGSSMFEFGVSYGGLRMAVVAAQGYGHNEVLPQDWQRYLGIEPRRKKKGTYKGESKPAFKGRLKAFAQRLYPDVKVENATADALLIALYGKRVWGK